MELTTFPQKQLTQSYDQKKEKSANKMELTTFPQKQLTQSYDQQKEKSANNVKLSIYSQKAFTESYHFEVVQKKEKSANMPFSNEKLNTLHIVPHPEFSPSFHRPASVEDPENNSPEVRREANGTCRNITQTIGTYKRCIFVTLAGVTFVWCWETFGVTSKFKVLKYVSSRFDDYDARNLGCSKDADCSGSVNYKCVIYDADDPRPDECFPKCDVDTQCIMDGYKCDQSKGACQKQ